MTGWCLQAAPQSSALGVGMCLLPTGLAKRHPLRRIRHRPRACLSLRSELTHKSLVALLREVGARPEPRPRRLLGPTTPPTHPHRRLRQRAPRAVPRCSELTHRQGPRPPRRLRCSASPLPLPRPTPQRPKPLEGPSQRQALLSRLGALRCLAGLRRPQPRLAYLAPRPRLARRLPPQRRWLVQGPPGQLDHPSRQTPRHGPKSLVEMFLPAVGRSRRLRTRRHALRCSALAARP
jgi:hypothetical protein